MSAFSYEKWRSIIIHKNKLSVRCDYRLEETFVLITQKLLYYNLWSSLSLLIWASLWSDSFSMQMPTQIQGKHCPRLGHASLMQNSRLCYSIWVESNRIESNKKSVESNRIRIEIWKCGSNRVEYELTFEKSGSNRIESDTDGVESNRIRIGLFSFVSVSEPFCFELYRIHLCDFVEN